MCYAEVGKSCLFACLSSVKPINGELPLENFTIIWAAGRRKVMLSSQPKHHIKLQ